MIKIACGGRDRRPSCEIVVQKPVWGHVNGAPRSHADGATAFRREKCYMLATWTVAGDAGNCGIFQGGELGNRTFGQRGWPRGGCANAWAFLSFSMEVLH